MLIKTVNKSEKATYPTGKIKDLIHDLCLFTVIDYKI